MLFPGTRESTGINDFLDARFRGHDREGGYAHFRGHDESVSRAGLSSNLPTKAGPRTDPPYEAVTIRKFFNKPQTVGHQQAVFFAVKINWADKVAQASAD